MSHVRMWYGCFVFCCRSSSYRRRRSRRRRSRPAGAAVLTSARRGRFTVRRSTLEYGRPFLRGRHRGAAHAAGQAWRVGADEATVLTSDKPLTFGALHLPAGPYTINAQPGPAWQLIFGRLRQPGQWGIPVPAGPRNRPRADDVARAGLSVEQLTCSIVATAAGGIFRIAWGTTVATAPFTVG